MVATKYISALVHGTPGAGKTRLANTLPGPRLVLDSEGGSMYLPCEFEVWDIASGEEPPPPELGWTEGGKDYSVIIDIHDWDTYRMAMDYWLAGDHPFNSIIIDSLTEIQTQLKEKINPQIGLGDQFERNSYGVYDQMLVHLERDVRAMRDITRPGAKKQCHSCIVVLTDTDLSLRKPMLVGALRKRIPQFIDLEMYLDIVYDNNGNERRAAQIKGNASVEAKCRPDELNQAYPKGIIYDPNFRKIIKIINTPINNNKETDNG